MRCAHGRSNVRRQSDAPGTAHVESQKSSGTSRGQYKFDGGCSKLRTSWTRGKGWLTQGHDPTGDDEMGKNCRGCIRHVQLPDMTTTMALEVWCAGMTLGGARPVPLHQRDCKGGC